jgi:hypothetical protein
MSSRKAIFAGGGSALVLFLGAGVVGFLMWRNSRAAAVQRIAKQAEDVTGIDVRDVEDWVSNFPAGYGFPGRATRPPPGYGIWPLSAPGTVARGAALRAAATAQIGLSMAWNPLGSLGEVDAPTAATESPSTRGGARDLVAYWLAVASRLAYGRSESGASSELVARARENMAAAVLLTPNTVASAGVPPALRLARASKIAEIVEKGSETARQHGQTDVADLLHRLADISEIRKAAGGGNTTLVVVGGAALVLIALLATKRLWWRKGMKRNPRMGIGERLARIGAGSLIGILGAVGWLGPQVAEPISTVIGGAATVGGIAIAASGVAGKAGLTGEIRRGLK